MLLVYQNLFKLVTYQLEISVCDMARTVGSGEIFRKSKYKMLQFFIRLKVHFSDGRFQIRVKGYKVKVTTDTETIEENIVCGVVSNSKSVAGCRIFKTFPQDNLTDGLLDITLIKYTKNIAEFGEESTALLLSSESPLIIRTNSKHVTFSFEDEYPEWTTDGEYGGEGQNIEIHVVPKGMQLIEKNPNTEEDK